VPSIQSSCFFWAAIATRRRSFGCASSLTRTLHPDKQARKGKPESRDDQMIMLQPMPAMSPVGNAARPGLYLTRPCSRPGWTRHPGDC
jgi:hypothetical protein